MNACLKYITYHLRFAATYKNVIENGILLSQANGTNSLSLVLKYSNIIIFFNSSNMKDLEQSEQKHSQYLLQDLTA